MYNYRTPKTTWWETHAQMRRFFLHDWPFMQQVRSEDLSRESWKSVSKLVDALAEHLDLDIQVFDEGETYLLRPLVTRLMRDHFMAHYGQWNLEPVWLDNRTDVPPEHEKNYAVATWTEAAIKARRYFVVTVLDERDFADVFFQRLRAGAS